VDSNHAALFLANQVLGTQSLDKLCWR